MVLHRRGLGWAVFRKCSLISGAGRVSKAQISEQQTCRQLENTVNIKEYIIYPFNQMDISSPLEAMSCLTVLSPLSWFSGPHSGTQDGSADPSLELRTLRPSEGNCVLEVTQGIGPGQGDLSLLGAGRERKEHVGVDARLLVCVRVQ